MDSITILTRDAFIQRDCSACAAINDELYNQFLNLKPESILRSSHLFEGRYENIYVREGELRVVETITDVSRRFAADALGMDPAVLKLGWWFNFMQPGQRTLPHRHDDDDELLSAVYYVRVPARSGNLILHNTCPATRVVPREGSFVFFRSDLLHEVTCNESEQARLSIGMNFGPRNSDF